MSLGRVVALDRAAYIVGVLGIENCQKNKVWLYLLSVRGTVVGFRDHAR